MPKTLIWLLGVSVFFFFGFIAVLLCQWRYLKKNPSLISLDLVARPFWPPTLTTFANILTLVLANSLKWLLESGYYHILIGLRWLISGLKNWLAGLERRFAHLSDALKGRRPRVNQKGSVSLFLTEVKRHRDELRGRQQV